MIEHVKLRTCSVVESIGPSNMKEILIEVIGVKIAVLFSCRKIWVHLALMMKVRRGRHDWMRKFAGCFRLANKEIAVGSVFLIRASKHVPKGC